MNILETSVPSFSMHQASSETWPLASINTMKRISHVASLASSRASLGLDDDASAEKMLVVPTGVLAISGIPRPASRPGMFWNRCLLSFCAYNMYGPDAYAV